MKLTRTYRPSVNIQIQRRKYDPLKKRAVAQCKSKTLTVRSTSVEEVYRVVKRAIEEASNG